LGAGVGLARHDLRDELAERFDPGLRGAPADDLPEVHVQGGEVGQGPAALILELLPARLTGPGRQVRMQAA